MLVRANGPGLSQINDTRVNPDPQVSVFSGATRLAGNDNWGGGATLTSAFSSVGAFGLPADSRDAAVILALIPGAYTAQVTGVGAAAGVTLVEVYELP